MAVDRHFNLSPGILPSDEMNSSSLQSCFANSSVHGLPHLMDTNKTKAERLFWAVVSALAFVATYSLIKANLHDFEQNAVNFMADTDYLSWNTTFPGFSVCEKENHRTISAAAEKIYGSDRNFNVEIFVRDVAFFDGTCSTCNKQCLSTLNCSGDLRYITRMTRSSCSQLIQNCQWNGQPFECCSKFLPLETEIGPCFTINTVNSHRDQLARLNLYVNRTTGPGTLTFTSVGDISVKEIYNDPQLRYLPLQQRGCRFHDEKIIRAYSSYSFSGCTVDCRAAAMLKLCNCTHHLMPKIEGVKTCDLIGLRCLTQHVGILRNPKCNCPASCSEPEYTVISNRIIDDPNVAESGEGDQRRKIVLKLNQLPTLRFKRVVVKTKLSLVVSMGGTIGLFLGASLLSIVEILYFLFLRTKTTK